MITYHQQKERGYGHVFFKLAVCRDAARRAALSTTAELLVLICPQSYLWIR